MSLHDTHVHPSVVQPPLVLVSFYMSVSLDYSNTSICKIISQHSIYDAFKSQTRAGNYLLNWIHTSALHPIIQNILARNVLSLHLTCYCNIHCTCKDVGYNLHLCFTYNSYMYNYSCQVFNHN